VYFNALVGGPRGAFTYYEMDYWGNCILEAVRWSAGQARSSNLPFTISGSPWDLVQLNAGRFPELQFVPTGRGRHYLHVQLGRGDILFLRRLAREPALYRVKTPDGAVLCTVSPGPAYGELEALLSRTPRRPASREAVGR
jgi:hypothetical protein